MRCSSPQGATGNKLELARSLVYGETVRGMPEDLASLERED